MASDSDSDEDFVTYGTPLEPLEEDEPLRKPIPIHEQTVKDEKGRFKRFHGAFTGGFSAGYFNTVGSKEGWTPSTFVSSRQQKAEKQQQQHARPEDFMDEEDLGEHGIAPAKIITSEEFQSGKRDQIRDKARAINSLSAPIPGDNLLLELISPYRSSIGVEILRRMGWKEGQGVGPRLKRKADRQETDHRASIYGCVLPPVGSEESEDDEEFAPENVTFAPKDVTPIDFNPKVGLQGLGYRGLDPSQALRGSSSMGHIDLFSLDSDRTHSLFGDQRHPQTHRRGVAGQAFGVGALEDEDEEVYHRDSMSNYDTVLGGEEPGDGLFGWTAPQQYRKKKERNRDASYLGKILEGFTLADRPAKNKIVFPPPELPRDYRPVHHFRPILEGSHLSPMVVQALQASRGQLVLEKAQTGRHMLDSGQRGTLLGEKALQGPTSVLDLLLPVDRERLASMRNSSHHPVGSAPQTVHDAPPSASRTAGAAAATQALAQQALASRFQQGALTDSKAFKPFEQNASKQARYELYVSRLQQGHKDALETSLDPSMTEWERSRERDEFGRAALLYRPTSSSLSYRFTSAKHRDDEDSVEVPRNEESDVNDKEAAAKMKMFGKLTRDSFEWHPDKLLCKRFNVPDPYPGSGVVGLPTVKRDRFSVFNFLDVAEPTAASASSTAQEPTKKSRWDVQTQSQPKEDPLSQFLSVARNQASAPQTASTQQEPNTQIKVKKEAGEEKEEEEEEEEESRLPMDLFKAIFASSSDEKSSSSSEDEGDEEKDGILANVGSQAPSLFSVASSETSSAALPLISFSAVQATGLVPSAAQPDPAEVQATEEFGPKLPPPSSALQAGSMSSSSPPTQRSRKDKRKAKKQHKHKKDKKKKKQKKHKDKDKEKKKRKAKSSRKEASGSSSEESEDWQPLTQELFKRLKSMHAREVW